jgi:hypothetical protein
MKLNGQSYVSITLVIIVVGCAVAWGTIRQDVKANGVAIVMLQIRADELAETYMPRNEIKAELRAIRTDLRDIKGALEVP